MHPAAFVVGIRRVVTVAGARSLMNDDGSQVVNTRRVGSTRFRSTVEHELRQIERCDGKVNAQVDFSSAKGREN